MKLQNQITLRLSLIGALVFAFWAALFYFAIIDEINDEVDDSLEDHAEMIIRRSLAGEKLPREASYTNNQYYLHEVSAQYASQHSHIRYEDCEVYTKAKNEFEPARTISYIFMDDNGKFFEVVVFTPTIDKADLKAAVAYWLIALYAAIVTCIILVNLHTLTKGMRPLRAILDWLDAYRLGERNKAMDLHTNVTEFRKLANALERSTERNETLYEQQKRFIANASHELQTPLAVIQSRLEMMLDNGQLTEAQMGDVVKTLHTLKTLARTNRSLLLLCKIDNGQFTKTKHISMAATIGRLLPDMEMIYANKNIKVEMNVEADMTAEMDESLATTLAANLLKNAFTHGNDGGRIRICLKARAMTIANTGGDRPLDGEKIFERFYHSADKASSTGLGLSIAQAICRLYGMDILYIKTECTCLRCHADGHKAKTHNGTRLRNKANERHRALKNVKQ